MGTSPSIDGQVKVPAMYGIPIRYGGKGGQRQNAGEILSHANKGITDDTLLTWIDKFRLTPPFRGLTEINYSSNALTDASGVKLGNALLEVALPLRVLKLFANRLGDATAEVLSKYVEHSKHPLAELHLSHNCITKEGASALLISAAASCDGTGSPRYPSCALGMHGRPVPLGYAWKETTYRMVRVSKLK